MLRIPQNVLDQLRRHGEEAYPEECCGVLAGSIGPAGRSVASAVPLPNAAGAKRNRYAIEPGDLVRALRQIEAQGWEILGFYHSHPDTAAAPSATDLLEAHWLGCSYVITRVDRGRAMATRSYLLKGDREESKRFAEEELHAAASNWDGGLP